MSDILLIPLYAIYGLIVITFALSIIWPIAKLNGWKQATAVLLVLVSWGIAYWYAIGRDRAERDWRVASWDVCKKDTASFPNWFRIDSFVDEATILTTQSILQLLSERGLRFVEIRVGKNQRSNGFIAFGHNQGDGYWDTSEAEGRYARLELGKKGDSSCAELPSHVKGRESKLPFLPDTCIKITYSDKTSSRYALELTPSQYSAWPNTPKYGVWTLTDRQTNQKLATVTTSDTSAIRQVGFMSDLLRIDAAQGPGQDCRTASGAIVNRVLAPVFPRESYPQLLRPEKDVASNTPLFDVSDPAIPDASSIEELTQYSESDQDMLFGSINSHAAWIKAIDQANDRGWGNFGPYLIDWKERTIRTLEHPKSDKTQWGVVAVNDGYVAYSPWTRSWYAEGSGLLLRYTSDGHLDWSARVIPPTNKSGKCDWFEPEAIYTEGANLILAATCGKRGTGAVWKVQLRDLPGKI